MNWSPDYSAPKRCEEELNIFAENSDYDIVGCFENEFENDIDKIASVHRVPETHKKINIFMKKRCAILHPTVIYKKSAVLACGGYKDAPLYEDYDLFIRMIQSGAK